MSVVYSLLRLIWLTGCAWLNSLAQWVAGYLRDYRIEPGCMVKTTKGVIRGQSYLFPGAEGRESRVDAYLGVPFARVGVYEERFKRAMPVEPWKGIRDCMEHGPRAIQQEFLWDRFLMPIAQDETRCKKHSPIDKIVCECHAVATDSQYSGLNMNIFAPPPPLYSGESESGRAVMVLVHGGGYLIHGAVNYGDWNLCKNLCLHGVIVCVVQYRLGLLGFLSTGDAECPGNYGLWDQLDAFKWIKENISAFGGDPNNITAVGQSAGGASVDLLSLSPHSAGLINRVALMGGNANGSWALSTPQRTIDEAIVMARKVGWNGSSSDRKGLLEFLKKQPSENLQAPLVGKSPFNLMKSGLRFGPVVDGDLIPLPVEELRRKTPPLTVIIGGAECEALLFHALGKNQSDSLSIKKFLEICIPSRLPNHDILREEASNIYTKGVDLSNKVAVSRAFLNLYSDALMNNSVAKYCREMVKADHKIYLYNFTYCDTEQFGFFGFRMPFLIATHCHDLRYLLGKGLYAKFRPGYDDFAMLDQITLLWTSFAKFGDPNAGLQGLIEWKPVEADDPYSYLELNLQAEMRSDFHNRRYEFWRGIEEQLARS